MALQNSDLFAVQQGVKVYSITAEKLREFSQSNFDPAELPLATTSTPGAVVVGDSLSVDGNGKIDVTLPKVSKFMGQLAATDDAPANPENGNLWIFNSAGTLNSTWVSVSGREVKARNAVIWSETASEWGVIENIFEAGVVAINASAPLSVDNAIASTPFISIAAATASVDGYLSKEDKAKLDSIQPGSNIGTVTNVTGTAPVQVANNTTTPTISVDYASNTAAGVAKIATDDEVTSGIATSVVHAGQLKVAKDDINSVEVRLDSLEANPGVELSSGQGIQIDNIEPGKFQISTVGATNSTVGSVTLATDVEVLTGTDNQKVLTPFTAAAVYLPKDISALPELI